METLFECRQTKTEAGLKEFYRHYFFGRTFVIVCHSIFLLSLIVNIAFMLMGKPYSIEVLIIVPLLFLLQIINYVRALSIEKKRMKEIGGEDVTVEIFVFDDHIQSKASNGADIRLEYGNIKYAVATKNIIYLLTKARLVHILRKDGFTKGSHDAFMGFLVSKGVKIK